MAMHNSQKVKNVENCNFKLIVAFFTPLNLLVKESAFSRS